MFANIINATNFFSIYIKTANILLFKKKVCLTILNIYNLIRLNRDILINAVNNLVI